MCVPLLVAATTSSIIKRKYTIKWADNDLAKIIYSVHNTADTIFIVGYLFVTNNCHFLCCNLWSILSMINNGPSG